jgi:hypothetical protein
VKSDQKENISRSLKTNMAQKFSSKSIGKGM